MDIILSILFGRSKKEYSLTDIENQLIEFGYEKNDIKSVFNMFYKLHLYYFISQIKNTIRINDLKIQAYIRLIREPAYIDNVTLETPLPEEYLPKIKVTNGHDDSHFIKRVESTLSFLSFLRQREEVFSDGNKFSQLYKAEYAWLLLGHSYLNRLKGIKSNPKVKINVSKEWWNKTLSSSFIKSIENEYENRFYPIK